MKTIKNFGLAAWIIAGALVLTAFAAKHMATHKNVDTMSGKGFAVLELFTSEGCSSCPPADALVAQIQQEAQGKPVYVLAYHVDYWDRLGWKDAFSSAAFSARQSEYSDWLHTQAYTPQLVINGQSEFIGSEEGAVRGGLAAALAGTTGVPLTLTAHVGAAFLNVHYEATTAPKGSNILVAIVQKHAQSRVARGENAGRSLSHVQIVRALQNQALSESGSGDMPLALPSGFNKADWEVIGLLQTRSSGEITGVTKAAL